MATNNGEASTKIEVTKPRAVGFRDLRDEMDRLWQAVMSPSRPFGFFNNVPPAPMPAMDVFEKDGQLHVRAELPGVSEKDIEITAEKDCLTIEAEKRNESEVKEEDYYRSERSYGHVQRQISLPANADVDNVTAQFKDGVLEISMPMKAAPEKKKIEVKAAK